MVNKLDLLWMSNFIALEMYFNFETKFFWNEENDTCFNIKFVLGLILIFFVVTACYLVVIARYRSFLLVTTFSMNAIISCFDIFSVRPTQIFQVQTKILTIWPVFPDYLSVSYHYVSSNTRTIDLVTWPLKRKLPSWVNGVHSCVLFATSVRPIEGSTHFRLYCCRY